MPNRAETFAITAILCAVAFTQAHSLPVSLDKYWTARIEQLMSALCNVDASTSDQSDPSRTGCIACSSPDSAKNCCLSKEERREECWRNVISRLQLDDDVREGFYDAIQEKRTRNKSLGKRTPQKRQRNTFLGKRSENDNSELDEVDFESIEKRPRNMSLGKRSSGSRNSFLGKRGRNTSLGKRGYDGGDLREFDDQNDASDDVLSDYADVGQQRFVDKRGRNTFLG